ncbi:START domain-containing protein [Mucilaginibacter sp. KACC 22063]|uniref:START domain-containing protein n=1 Tax=Mucilaginibacter sp. KACC 22063 TaxID=3025666 RepID=UPI002365AC4D|nr:START domain-containing protein [Mucilaginibacter sp. KACC 22063]WDF56929.1 START domain-containing protein [Mucilaginibacter sp. KACC 22063]
MGIKLKALLFLSVLIINTAAFAQSDWKLKTEEEGIKVYMRSEPNSNFKAIKVNCEVDATLSQFVAIIMDIKNSVNWAYHTKSATVLKQVSPSELYYYSEVEVPWPAQNRDFISHITVKQNQQNHTVIIDAPCIPDYVPAKPNIVRVPRSAGKWIIEPVSDKRLKVEYTLSLDPGGNVPAWLINMFAAQGPMQMFKALKKELQKPAYQHQQLAYIIN